MALSSFLGSYADPTNSSLMFRNRIINGDMRIDQRNNGSTLTPALIGSGYTLDRWRYYISQISKVSFARSTVAPAGFSYSLLCTSTSSYPVTSSDVFQIGQVIEGFNVADAAFGTSDAKTVVLSFWTRSSLTGTIGGALVNIDGTRSYPFSFSISSANTWEYKQIIIQGDTTGTWSKTETAGLRVRFNLGSGSSQSAPAGSWIAGDYNAPTGAISLVGTSGATFYVTGVQLELGPLSTPFEYRLYSQELALCQRYYERWQTGDAYGRFGYAVGGGTTSAIMIYNYKVEKRTHLATLTSGGAFQAAVGAFTSMNMSPDGRSASTAAIDLVGTGWTAFQAFWIRANNNAATFVGFDAEL